MKIAGGLDVGTTGCKIALYDENANHIETYYCEYDATYEGGQYEIDFEKILSGVKELLKKATSKYEIATLGVTSFGESFVMLDDKDKALSPSLLYTDPRGSEESQILSDKFGKENLTFLTGVIPHSMYSISKILWHKKNTSDIFDKCKKILLGEDYIIYSLTGVRQISYSLASRTGAFDIEKKVWLKDVFDFCNVDTSLMSNPVQMGTLAGKLSHKVKKELGIDYDIQVVNGAHDQVANMIGAGIFSSNQSLDATGTVECIPVILKEKPTNLEFYKYGYCAVPYINNSYACYAFSFTGGATLKWFRDNFAENEKTKYENAYKVLDSNVKDEPTDILILPHFAGAATPYMDSESKAAFLGVTLETDKFDLYKALMEGTSYEMLLNFNLMRKFTEDITELRATGGGASSDVWLQIKADILEKDITALNCRETGAAGVAVVAGKAVGIYQDIESAIEKISPTRKVFTCNEEKSKKYRENYEKYSKLYDMVKSI